MIGLIKRFMKQTMLRNIKIKLCMCFLHKNVPCAIIESESDTFSNDCVFDFDVAYLSNSLRSVATKDVRQNLGFSNTPLSGCVRIFKTTPPRTSASQFSNYYFCTLFSNYYFYIILVLHIRTKFIAQFQFV